MNIQRIETETIIAWNADTQACEDRSITYFSVGGSTFWMATESTDDDIISAAYRNGAQRLRKRENTIPSHRQAGV